MKLVIVALVLSLTIPVFGADFIITIPNDQVTRVVNGMALTHGYQDTLNDGSPNPETKNQFAKRMLRKFVKSSVITAEAIQAADIARDIARQNAEAEISITSN